MCHSFRRTVLIAYAGVIRAIRWTAREIVVQRHKLFKVDHRRAAAVTRHLAASRDRRKTPPADDRTSAAAGSGISDVSFR
jgi:hypothetical protein